MDCEILKIFRAFFLKKFEGIKSISLVFFNNMNRMQYEAIDYKRKTSNNQLQGNFLKKMRDNF